MEFEQLENGKKCITSAIARQDVADYYELLHPNVMVVSHFKYPPAPLIVADTIPLLARAQRRNAKRVAAGTESQNKSSTQMSSGTTATGKTKNSNTTDAGNRKNAVGVKGQGKHLNQQISATGKKAQEQGKGADTYEVDVVEGQLLATERLYAILSWMNAGKFIAETSVEMDARKVILHETEMLPPPPPPKNEAERCRQLGRQHTDRNQRLSKLTVTFGRVDLLFRDECYFEDGFIVTVHRFMLTTQEMLGILGLSTYQQRPQVQQCLERMAAERESFYAATKTRVDCSNHSTLPLLDFTFCNVPNPLQLMRLRPVSGKKHVPRSVQPILEPHIAQGVFFNQQSDMTRVPKEQRVIIKARNKQGDEEVYEFVENAKSRYGFLTDSKACAENALEKLAEALESSYAATRVRFSDCGMVSTEGLVPVLRRLVVNAIMTIRSLDLSCNNISILPDLSLLPLQHLHLHKNNISNWDEVENKVCPLPLLDAVSLNGNPIAENEPQYWQVALARLLRHPKRIVRLRQLDYVTLTLQDYSMAGAHELFETGNSSLLEASRGKKSKTNGLVY